MFRICVILSFFLRFAVCCKEPVIAISDERYTQPYYLHYDAPSHSLYSTDYAAREIRRFDFDEKRTYSATIENDIVTSFIIPVEDTKDKFIVCYNFTVAMIKWNGKENKAKVIQDEIIVRPKKAYPIRGWDYGKVAPNYEFYGGSFRANMCSKSPSTRNAALYHINKPILKHLRVSGAFDWNVKEKLFYHCDTCNRAISEYDWNPKTGHIYNGRIVYKFKHSENGLVMPHGMTIDTDGCLYVAMYMGGKVLKVDPKKKRVIDEYEIPATGVSMITFGGRHLNILFVATQRCPFELPTGKLILDTSPGSGSIYMIKLKTKGYPARNYSPIARIC